MEDTTFLIAIISVSLLLIVILTFLIARAYLKRQPLFYKVNGYFKPEMFVEGTISIPLAGIAALFLIFAMMSLQLLGYWHQILLIPILISLITLVTSSALLFLSFDWQVKNSIYRYIGIHLFYVSILVQYTKGTLNIFFVENQINSPEIFERIPNLPFAILGFVGMMILAIISGGQDFNS